MPQLLPIILKPDLKLHVPGFPQPSLLVSLPNHAQVPNCPALVVSLPTHTQLPIVSSEALAQGELPSLVVSLPNHAQLPIVSSEALRVRRRLVVVEAQGELPSLVVSLPNHAQLPSLPSCLQLLDFQH